MSQFIGIGLVIVIVVALLRALNTPSPHQPAQPQIIYVQALPHHQKENSGAGGVGALFLLLVAIVAAITLFPA